MEYFHPVIPDPFARPLSQSGEIIDSTGTVKHIIDTIVAHAHLCRHRDHTPYLYYQVRWFGYDKTIWEPADTLRQDIPDLFKAYHHTHPLS